MELFTKYNVPSDLLAYDGPVGKDTSEKIAAVQCHVKGMYDMIASIKAFLPCFIRSSLPHLWLYPKHSVFDQALSHIFDQESSFSHTLIFSMKTISTFQHIRNCNCNLK